uniref:Uncharacterized protein n=1 Tax=Brassica oleracea TaxID=3712 RepID=A0A3P6G760_BRAOL|nr:unnamed protein product [Brassica oleracea]
MRKDHYPDFLFLMETKQKDSYMIGLQKTLGYDRMFTVAPEGLSGGLTAGFEDAVRRGWDGGTGDNSSIMDRLSGYSIVDLTLKVSDLFILNTDLWDKEKVRDTFTPEDAERVLKLKPLLSRPDSDVWGLTNHMGYTTQSAYQLLSALKYLRQGVVSRLTLRS